MEQYAVSISSEADNDMLVIKASNLKRRLEPVLAVIIQVLKLKREKSLGC
jgi:hypothetical protein